MEYLQLAGVPGVASVNKVRKLCNLIPPKYSICPPKYFIISICEIPLPHLPLPVAQFCC